MSKDLKETKVSYTDIQGKRIQARETANAKGLIKVPGESEKQQEGQYAWSRGNKGEITR